MKPYASARDQKALTSFVDFGSRPVHDLPDLLSTRDRYSSEVTAGGAMANIFSVTLSESLLLYLPLHLFPGLI